MMLTAVLRARPVPAPRHGDPGPHHLCRCQRSRTCPSILFPIKISLSACISQLDPIPVDKITRWEQEFRSHLTSTQGPLLQEISNGQITPEIEGKIKKIVEDHVSSFTS